MWVRSLGQEDPLEEGKATHSSILAWRIPWTEEPGGLQSMGSQKSQDMTEQEYWSGLACPPLGDLPDPGIKPTRLTSPALAAGFFTTSADVRVGP